MESKEDLEDDGGIKNERVEMQQNERREQEVQEICREDEERERGKGREEKVWGVVLGGKKAVDEHCAGPGSIEESEEGATTDCQDMSVGKKVFLVVNWWCFCRAIRTDMTGAWPAAVQFHYRLHLQVSAS